MGTSEYGHALWLPWREGRVASNRGMEGAVKQKKKKFKDSERSVVARHSGRGREMTRWITEDHRAVKLF